MSSFQCNDCGRPVPAGSVFRLPLVVARTYTIGRRGGVHESLSVSDEPFCGECHGRRTSVWGRLKAFFSLD